MGTSKRPPLQYVDKDCKPGRYQVPDIRTLTQKSKDLHVYKTGLDGMVDWNEKELLEEKKKGKSNQNFMGRGTRPDLFPVDKERNDAQDKDEYIYNHKTAKIQSDFPDQEKLEKWKNKKKST